MFRVPQTKSELSIEKMGSCESDTALKLSPALHVLPAMLPSMCM